MLYILENKGSRWQWSQALNYRGVNWWHSFSLEKNKSPTKVHSLYGKFDSCSFCSFKNTLWKLCQLLQTT